MPFTKKRYETKAKWKKYKSCVKKVRKKKVKRKVNPYAVCRTSIYEIKKCDHYGNAKYVYA